MPTWACGPTRTRSPTGSSVPSRPTSSPRLLPEVQPFAVSRFPLPNLRAVNFVVHGILGWGVASSLRLDTQAKGLGELLRARLIDVPAPLVASGAPAARLASA